MRKFVVTGALLTTIAALAAGCGGASDDQEAGQITFRSFDPPAEVAGLEKAVSEWNAAHKVKVKVETVPVADALAQYTREAGAGAGPDVAQLAFTWTRNLGDEGLLEPVQDRLGSDASKFLGTDLNSSADGKKLYALPWSADTFALAYDPAVLKEAGIATPPATWDELAVDAKRLTTPKRAGFCFAASSGPTAEIWHLLNAYLWSNGVDLVSGAGPEWKPAASDADVAAAFKYLHAFFAEGSTPKSMLSVENAGDPAINAALAAGDCAIAFMSPPQVAVAVAANPKITTVTMPAGSSGSFKTHLGGRSLGINPNSRHLDEAWEFVRFLSTREVFEKYYTGQFPAQPELLAALPHAPERDAFAKELTTAQSYVQYADTGVPVPEFWSLAVQALGKVNSGQTTPDKGAAEFLDQLAKLKS